MNLNIHIKIQFMQKYPNAKINIGLNITEKRPDGYHNIETIFYPIGLCDILDVEISETCTDYGFSSSGIQINGDPEDNLIIKAYRLLQNDFELPPVDISLIKQIPFGAGLGGGSSDAAFMLKTLNELCKLNLSQHQLETYAVQIGADCPVFIYNKPVFATGIGNIFSPVSLNLSNYFLLLVKPDIHISTPEAYALVSPLQPEKSLSELIKEPVEKWKNLIKNDFEESVFSKYPAIKEIKQQLYDAGAVYASMSGSGSSVYGIFKSEPDSLPDFQDCFITWGKLEE